MERQIKLQEVDHKPYTFDLYFISHIPGIIHSKTDSTYEYIAGYVKIGVFPSATCENPDLTRFVWDFQGSGFGCIAAKSSKCLLQKLRRPLVKTSHDCASMAQHSRRSFAFNRFRPLFFGVKRSKNYRTTDPKQCVARCRVVTRPNMGPMQVSLLRMVALGK